MEHSRAGGFIASVMLLHGGMHRMVLRYPLAVLGASIQLIHPKI